MPATNYTRYRTGAPASRQAGVAAVEFALLALIFFTFVFGIIEIARLLYVFNTLQEVTRRAAGAAASVYATDSDATARVRQYAIFRNTPGGLVLAPPITDEHIRLEYLRFDLSVIPSGTLPVDAAANRGLCMMDPHAANCIRFVQAQVCDPAESGQCNPVRFQMLLPLIDLRMPLHKATTITPIESFGYVPGTLPPPCPC
jgi:hypothetical protein